MRALIGAKKETAGREVGTDRPWGVAGGDRDGAGNRAWHILPNSICSTQDSFATSPSRTINNAQNHEYAALSPDDRGQGPASDQQWRAETEWSAEIPAGLGEQPAETREAEWAALRRLAGIMRTGVTAWAWEHRDWDREDISCAAQGRMLWWLRQRKAWTRSFKLRYGREPSERATVDSTEAIRAERRNMRRCVRQAREAEALWRGRVGSRGQQAKYASRRARHDRREQLEQEAEWKDTSLIVDLETGEAIPLTKVVRTSQQKRAKHLAVTSGLTKLATERGLYPYFTTLTCPPNFHPAPKFGTSKWDGSLPRASQAHLAKCWARARARFAKARIYWLAFRYPEPHADACTHWHMPLFLPESRIAEVTAILTDCFGAAGPAVRIERARDIAAVGKYCMAYAAKTTACADGKMSRCITGDELDGNDAWRSTWGIRGYQICGAKGMLGLWDEMRRKLPKDAPAEIREIARQARAGDYAAFHRVAAAAGARLATVAEKREFPHPDPEVHAEVKAGQAQAERQLRRLAAEHGVPVDADTPPADLVEPLLARAGDDAETVREIREAETALTRRAVVTVTRRRTVGVHLGAHGICVTTRTRHWVLIRAEESAAASAAALAISGITVTADSGGERARTGEMPAGQAPPDGPVIQP